MNAEQMAVVENFPRMFQRTQRLLATRTIYRKYAHRGEPPLLESALKPTAFEIFSLAHEMDHPRARQRQQRIINNRKMIGRNDGTPCSRDVFQSLGGWVNTQTDDRTDHRDKEPVEHEAPFRMQLALRQIRVVTMTDLHNSNADDKRPSEDPSNQDHSPESGPESDADLQEEWSAFESSYADELNDVASSRSARHFEKHAERKEREALLSVKDLDQGSFADDARPRGRGPRDYTHSSWLDVDSVMDHSGSDFIPPNPKLGHFNRTTFTLWSLLIIGVAGVIATVFFPALAAVLGTIFGACVLIGGAGLIIQHRDRGGHTSHDDDNDRFPHGARI